jgi:hypothetical protein
MDYRQRGESRKAGKTPGAKEKIEHRGPENQRKACFRLWSSGPLCSIWLSIYYTALPQCLFNNRTLAVNTTRRLAGTGI